MTLNAKLYRKKFFKLDARHWQGQTLAAFWHFGRFSQKRPFLAAIAAVSWLIPGLAIYALTGLKSFALLLSLAGAFAFLKFAEKIAKNNALPLSAAMERAAGASPNPRDLNDWELEDRLPGDPWQYPIIDGKPTFSKRTVSGETRNAAGVSIPHRITVELQIPQSQAVLHMGAALSEQALPKSGVIVRAELNAKTIYQRRLEPLTKHFDGFWKDFSADLSAYRGQKIKLTLSTEWAGPAEPEAQALWSEPRIILSSVPRTLGGKAKPRKAILIVMDACMPKMLGCLGSPEDTSPAIDKAFSHNSALFSNAFAQSSWTTPCFASMLTSLYPSSHGVYPTRPHHLRRPIQAQHATFPELLRAEGFATSALVSHHLASAGYGFARGFDSFTMKDNILEEDHSYGVTTRGIEFLRKTEGHDSFLLLHYFDSHYPYFLRSPYDSRFGFDYNGGFNHEENLKTPRAFSEDEQRAILSLYRGAVHKVDRALDLLFSYLKETGQFDESLIMLTSDHGLEFFDHAGFQSGAYALYDEFIHVPLLIKSPASAPLKKTGVCPEPVEASVSLAPTLLDSLGLPVPSSMQGASLAPWLEGVKEAPPKDPIVSESLDTKKNIYEVAVRDSQHKLIFRTRFDVSDMSRYKTEGAEVELYDLSRDPSEKNNLANSKPELCARYRALAEAHAQKTAPPEGALSR